VVFLGTSRTFMEKVTAFSEKENLSAVLGLRFCKVNTRLYIKIYKEVVLLLKSSTSNVLNKE